MNLEKTLFLTFVFFQACFTKICWKECSSQNIIKSVDLVGCHRRSTYPHQEDFKCSSQDGMLKGPPCTAKKGDTFELHVEFVNLTVSDMTQYAYWETGWVDVPWVTMDSEACPYLDSGHGCNNKTRTSEPSFLVMPIPVDPMYPGGDFLFISLQ